MANPALWCEARCHFFCAGVGSDGGPACHETAQGAFGAAVAAKTARAAGWRVVEDEWCCPACWRVIAAARPIPERP
jgi:hypothetical protein